jgi:hypothetical protein
VIEISVKCRTVNPLEENEGEIETLGWAVSF